jgi:hypothetical protein
VAVARSPVEKGENPGALSLLVSQRLALTYKLRVACHGGTSPSPTTENGAQSATIVDAGKRNAEPTQTRGFLRSDPAGAAMASIPAHPFMFIRGRRAR